VTELVKQLEQWSTIEKAHPPYNSPVWPFKKTDRIWHVTIDCRALNKATGPLSAPVPSTVDMDMLSCGWERGHGYGLYDPNARARQTTVCIYLGWKTI